MTVPPSKQDSPCTGPCCVCTATASAVGTVRAPTVDTPDGVPIRDPEAAEVRS